MTAEGHGAPLNAPTTRREHIRLNFTAENRKGVTVFVTEFEFPNGSVFEFIVPVATAAPDLEEINRQINEQAGAGYPPEATRRNILEIGRRLSRVLLHTPVGIQAAAGAQSSSEGDRATLVSRLAMADGPVQIRSNLPYPIELLAFDESVGGVDPFSEILAGRPELWFVSREHYGRPAGAGAAYFHDAQTPSVGDGSTQRAVEQVFEGLTLHEDLPHGDMSGAQKEIDRLLKATSAWAHFQSHTDVGTHKMRLTNRYMAVQQEFRQPNPTLTAVLLNTCRATHQTAADPVGPTYAISWAEYFTADCNVPAAIGPFCSILDEDTKGFTMAFYSALKLTNDVPTAFATARMTQMLNGDFAPLLYRYIGPPKLSLPAPTPHSGTASIVAEV